MSWTQGCEYRRASHSTYLPCGNTGECPSPLPLLPIVGRKADPEVTKVKELSLPFTYYSTRIAGLYLTVAEQQS